MKKTNNYSIYNAIKTSNDYKSVFDLMEKFHCLTSREKRIIHELMKADVIESTYATFNDIILNDKKHCQPNTRKALLRLEKMGIICICKKYIESTKNKSNPMQACFLIDGWLDVLLNLDKKDIREIKYKAD